VNAAPQRVPVRRQTWLILAAIVFGILLLGALASWLTPAPTDGQRLIQRLPDSYDTDPEKRRQEENRLRFYAECLARNPDRPQVCPQPMPATGK